MTTQSEAGGCGTLSFGTLSYFTPVISTYFSCTPGTILYLKTDLDKLEQESAFWGWVCSLEERLGSFTT